MFPRGCPASKVRTLARMSQNVPQATQRTQQGFHGALRAAPGMCRNETQWSQKEQKLHKQGHTHIINLWSVCGPNCCKHVIITMYSVEQQLVAPKGKLSDVRFGTPPWS